MTSAPPLPPTRQQLIRLLRQHKQEWRSLYGLQDITLFGSLARDEATASVDVVARWQGMNPALLREVERDAFSI